MSLLKFAHYKVQANAHGVTLARVQGLANCYCATCLGIRVYLFSDEEVIQYVNAL